MDADRWTRVRALFGACLERQPEERASFLDRECGDDPELRGEVESLLAAHRRSGDFLDGETAADDPDQTTPMTRGSGDPMVGRSAGPYRVLHLLNRGGMGAVYLAVRRYEDVEKRVALKVLHPGMASDEILRRFRMERRILAALDHPNIAKLLDAGSTEDGVPYLVMEFVDGEPLDAYCDHQNLVVHRDLKPANILVTADGTPKLLDFGIAKLINPELSSRTISATILHPLTPAYASPEQVRGEPITTASDVYSLGVILYRMLTGHHPYHVTGTSPTAVERVICDSEPERPSTVVLREQTVAEADGTTRDLTPATVSRTREGDPRRLRRRLVGDLDNIVLMALRKEPQRRYATAEQLAEDIRRHLDGRPVAARRDTVLYRCSKFVRRHGWGVAAASLFVAALLGFGIAMAAQRAEIAHQRDRAEEQRERAEQVTGLLIDLFETSDPLKPTAETASALDILDSAARRLSTELASQPEVRATLTETLGLIFQRLGLFDRARPLLETALASRRQALGDDAPEVAKSLEHLGELATYTGDYAEADRLLREALARRRALFGDDSPEVADTLDAQGVLLQERGDYAAAEPLHRQALVVRRTRLERSDPALADNLQNLASSLYYQGKLEEAEPLYREALELNRRYRGQGHPHAAQILNDLGAIRFSQGDYEAAEGLFREALARREALLGDHPDVAEGMNNLAIVLYREHHYEEAEKLYRRALELRRRFFGDDHPLVANSLSSLAGLLTDRGEPAAAEAPAREALAILRRTLTDDDWRLAMVKATLGGCLTGLGRYQEAEALLRDSYRNLVDAQGEASPNTRRTVERLVTLYEAWGKEEEAATYRARLAAPPRP